MPELIANKSLIRISNIIKTDEYEDEKDNEENEAYDSEDEEQMGGSF